MTHNETHHFVDTDNFSADEGVDEQLSRAISFLRLSRDEEDRLWDAAETFTDEEILAGTTISIRKKKGAN